MAYYDSEDQGSEDTPNPENPLNPEPQHLGDGVYISFDGYQLWLAANHHSNRVIAIEPRVLLAMVEYARRIDLAVQSASPGDKYFGV